MYKWYQVLVQDLDENIDENLKDLDENHVWVSQITEDPKGIEGTLLPPSTHTVNVIELHCKVIKKWQPPISTSTPSLSGLSPLSNKTFCTPPPKWLNFWKVISPLPPLPPSFKRGCSNYVATTSNLKKNTAVVLRRLNKMLLKPLHYYQ